MKMNRLFITGALLLGSLSALGMSVSYSKDGTFLVREANFNNNEVLKLNTQAKNAETPVLPGDETTLKFENGDSNLSKVSQSIAQTKDNGNNTKTLRFVSAVKVEIGDFNSDGKLDVKDGGQFGFHLYFEKNGVKVDRQFNISNYYLSLVTAGKTYYAPDSTKGENPNMDAFLTDAYGNVEGTKLIGDKNAEGYKPYNAFIALEIANIPSDFEGTFKAQPYFISDDNKEVSLLSNYPKEADIKGGSIYYLNVQKNETTFEKTRMSPSIENVYMGKDEYVSLDTPLEKGDKVTILDSYGKEYPIFDTHGHGTDKGYDVVKDGNYNFYYKTMYNNDGAADNKEKTWYDTQSVTMYIKPSTEWKEAGARFAAAFFNSNNTSYHYWLNFDKVNDDYYKVTIPSGYDNVVVCRMNGGTTENNWNNKWTDMTVKLNVLANKYDANNCVEISGWNENTITSYTTKK